MTTSLTGGLSTLRRTTDELHAQVEAQLALPQSLSSHTDVLGFILRWAQLSRRLEPLAGALLPTSLLPALRADAELLGGVDSLALFDANDLRAVDGGTLRVEQPGHEPAEYHRDELAAPVGDSLGVAWVLAGARLGLKSLQPRLTALVGEPLQLCDQLDGSAIVALRQAVDACDDVELQQVISDARFAFRAAAETLRGAPWQ